MVFPALFVFYDNEITVLLSGEKAAKKECKRMLYNIDLWIFID